MLPAVHWFEQHWRSAGVWHALHTALLLLPALVSLSLTHSLSLAVVSPVVALSRAVLSLSLALFVLSRFTCRRCTIASLSPSPSLWADFGFSFKTNRERSTALRTLLVRYVVVVVASPSRRCSRNSYVLQLLLLLLLLFCCCCCCCVLRWLRSFFFFVFYFLLTVWFSF